MIEIEETDEYDSDNTIVDYSINDTNNIIEKDNKIILDEISINNNKCIDCNIDVIHNNYTEMIKKGKNIDICNDCMLYKVKNKIPLDKKINKCEFKLTDYYKCIASATIIHNNKFICKYHYNNFILKIIDCEGCGLDTSICLCKKNIKDINILSSDEEYESDSEKSDVEDIESIPKEINKEPDKKIYDKKFYFQKVKNGELNMKYN